MSVYATYVSSALHRAAMVPVDAVRILLRHLPAMVTVIAVGLAARALVIWLAVWVSGYSSLAAALIVPFAPMAVMASLIVAMWLMLPSLPTLRSVVKDSPVDGDIKFRLLTVGGLLIPFLTVYASNGLLQEDVRAYVYDTTMLEATSNLWNVDWGRTVIDATWQLAMLVIVAVVARKLVGFFALGERGIGFASLSAYLEVLWMVTISVIITSQLETLRNWITTRAVIAPVVQDWTDVKTWAVESTGIVGELVSWIIAVIGRMDDVVIIPVAWLTMGLTIYGANLAAQKAATNPSGEGAARARASRRHRISSAVRTEARTALDTAAQPIAGPVKSTVKAIGQIAAAGLAPMITFCVLFALAKAAEFGVLNLGRLLLGPQDMWVATAVQPYIMVIGRLVYFLVALALVAPAIERLIAASIAQNGADAETRTSGPVTSSGVNEM